MPQPNQGKPGKPSTSTPIHGGNNPGPKMGDNIKFGAPGGKGTKGK